MTILFMSDKQDKFFSKFIGEKYLLKAKKLKQERLKAASDLYQERKGRIIQTLRNLPPNFETGSNEAEQLKAIYTRVGNVDNALPTSGKSLKAAVAALEDATVKLGIIERDLNVFVQSLTQIAPGGDDGQGIRNRKALAMGKLNTAQEDYRQHAAPILQRLAERAGKVVHPEVSAQFDKQMGAISDRIRKIAETGQTLDQARPLIEAEETAIEKALADGKLAMTNFDGSEGFIRFADMSRVMDEVQAALSSANGLSDDLDNWGIPGGAEFRREAEILLSRADDAMKLARSERPSDGIAAERNLKGVLGEAERLLSRVEGAVREARDNFEFDRLAPAQELTTIRNAFAQIDRKSFQPEQLTQFEQLFAMADKAVNGLNGCNRQALEAAWTLVDEAKAALGEAKQIATINKAILDKLDEVGRALKPVSGTKEPNAERIAARKTQLTDLRGSWVSMMPKAALDAAEALLTDAMKDVQVNADLVQLRAAMSRRIDEVAAEIEELSTLLQQEQKAQGVKVAPYRGQLLDRLNTCRTWNATKATVSFYTTIESTLAQISREAAKMMDGLRLTSGKSSEEVLREAVALRNELDRELNAILDSTGGLDFAQAENARKVIDQKIDELSTRNALFSEEDRLASAERAQAEKRETYLQDSKEFLTKHRSLLKSAKGTDPYKEYAKDIEANLDRVEKSRDTVKKGAAADSAISELAFVGRSIEGIIARGTKTTTKNLDQIGADWKTSQTQLLSKMNELVRAVAALESTVPETKTGRETLEKSLSAIAEKLDPEAFEPAARIFGDPEASEQDRKVAREMAMVQVRRLATLLDKDPVIANCVENPFKVRDFKSVVTRRLRQIELNVLRGV